MIGAGGAVSQVLGNVPGGLIFAVIFAGITTAGGVWLKLRKSKVLEYSDLLRRAKERTDELEKENTELRVKNQGLWDDCEKRRRALLSAGMPDPVVPR